MRRAFHGIAEHARGPVVARTRFFPADLALRTAFGMFRSWQRGQVDIQPQPVLGKGMAEGVALAPKQGVAPVAQLGNVGGRKDRQRACQRRLIRKVGPAPRPRQREIGAQAGIDLHQRTTADQDTDEDIQQLVGRRMIHHFQGQVQVGKDRGEKVGAREAVAEHAQRGKGGIFWQVRQLDLGAHGTAPHSYGVTCILPDETRRRPRICYPQYFAQN